MTGSAGRSIVAAIAGVLLLHSTSVHGEVVRLLVGPNQFGQGWMFLDRDGRCKVLTAGHVVAPSGTATRVLVLDRRGRQLETDPPEILALPQPDEVAPDMALLPVRTTGDSDGCSQSRLSLIGIDRRVQDMRSAVVETTARTETQIIPVQRLASLRDAAGGQVFVVRPRDPAVTFSQGWSGSILRDDEGPLGVVVAAPDGTEATVLRVDMLNRLARRVPQRPSAATRFSQIITVRGESGDAAKGPSGALQDSEPSWAVRPDRGWIVVQLVATQPQTLYRIVVDTDPAVPATLLGVIVEVGLRGREGWTFEQVRSCRLQTPTYQISCDFLEQTRSLVQVSLSFQNSNGVLIRRIRAN